MLAYARMYQDVLLPVVGCASLYRLACGIRYQLVPSCIWYQMLGDANPIRYKAFVAAFCYGFRWYGRWIQARIYCQAGRMLGNADPIQYKAFIGVFQAMAQANLVSCFC